MIHEGLLIGLTGRAGSGKDTIGAALGDLAGFRRVAFADALKAAAYASDPLVELTPYGPVRRLAALVDSCGWDEAKRHPDVRRYLQRYGQGIRTADPEFWVDVAMGNAHDHLIDGWPVVITDVRYPNEVDAIRDRGGVVVRLVRENAARLTSEAAGHTSEAGVDLLDVDLVPPNDGNARELAETLIVFAGLFHEDADA